MSELTVNPTAVPSRKSFSSSVDVKTTEFAQQPKIVRAKGDMRRHKSHKQLVETVQEVGQKIDRQLVGAMSTAKGDYGQLLSGMTTPGEQPALADQSGGYLPIDFTNVVVTPRKMANTEKTTMEDPKYYPSGRLYLSKTRLLILSSQPSSDAAVICRDASGERIYLNGRPAQYELDLTAGDATFFTAIPLVSVRSLQLDMSSKSSKTATIASQEPNCCNVCLWTCCWCCCKKTWAETESTPIVQTKTKEISFGALMPPWDEQQLVTIKFPQNVTIDEIAAFSSVFQRCSPHLAQAYTGGGGESPVGAQPVMASAPEMVASPMAGSSSMIKE